MAQTYDSQVWILFTLSWAILTVYPNTGFLKTLHRLVLSEISYWLRNDSAGQKPDVCEQRAKILLKLTYSVKRQRDTQRSRDTRGAEIQRGLPNFGGWSTRVVTTVNCDRLTNFSKGFFAPDDGTRGLTGCLCSPQWHSVPQEHVPGSVAWISIQQASTSDCDSQPEVDSVVISVPSPQWQTGAPVQQQLVTDWEQPRLQLQEAAGRPCNGTVRIARQIKMRVVIVLVIHMKEKSFILCCPVSAKKFLSI